MPIQGLISLQTLNSMGAETVHSLVTIPSLWKDVYNKRKVCHAAKSLQSCLTLCDPIDGSPPGSPVPGILQARTLEWVAISFSNAWKWKVKVKSLSCVRLLATPWTAAFQAPPSMGFSRQEDWSGVPLPSPSVPWSLYYLGTMKKSELKFFGFWELQSIIHILSNLLII